MNTLLVVDDFGSVRLFHAGLLRKAGYDCTAVASGDEAWAELQKKPFNGMVLDLLMPGLSGLELLRRLRSDRRISGLPVVVITSEGQAAVADDPFTLVLTKPVMPKQLVDAVHTLVGHKGGVSC